MFSTPYSLKKRTGKFDLERGAYLKQLNDEYKSVDADEEKKEQVLANLGNFAYDPINYEYFRRFGIIDTFLTNIKENYYAMQNEQYLNPRLLNFSLAAVCNLCLDVKNRDYLMKNDLFKYVMPCFEIEFNSGQSQFDIVLNLLTLLIFTFEHAPNKDFILNFKNAKFNFIERIVAYSKSDNRRLSNLAIILLQDHLYKKTDVG